jgi:hypothetical protein
VARAGVTPLGTLAVAQFDDTVLAAQTLHREAFVVPNFTDR